MSQITTHILDTAIGKPAADVLVELTQKTADGSWQTLAEGKTNADGRVADLLSNETVLPTGIYKMTFYTEGYFEKQNRVSFYPVVDIQFSIFDASHYHIPLLLSPFGYSTYRGS